MVAWCVHDVGLGFGAEVMQIVWGCVPVGIMITRESEIVSLGGSVSSFSTGLTESAIQTCACAVKNSRVRSFNITEICSPHAESVVQSVFLGCGSLLPPSIQAWGVR